MVIDELNEKSIVSKVSERWTAKRDGEIYIYINKPVLGIWGIETLISKHLISNTGKARIVIQRLN